jgi:plasmid stabilization system protein ParE
VTWPVAFLPAARLEVSEARNWYENEAAGLGAQFMAQLDEQVQRIARDPLRYPIMLGDVRRLRLRRFPYGVFYRVVDETVFVIACFHSSRDPHIWQGRT